MPTLRRRGRRVAGVRPPNAAAGVVIAAGTPATSGFDHDRLARAAIRVLIQNWHGHATVPSRSLYPHQWSWDSAFIAMGLEHFAPRRAAVEVLSLCGAQWSDGRIPHIAFNPAVAGRVYPHLVAQNSYLRQRRTVGELAAVVHPWETGLDNLPTWDAPLHAVPSDLSLFKIYRRRDLDHAPATERPTNEDYSRYIRLALAYRDSGYDDDEVRQNGEFLVVDPAFNALWARSELALAEIARSLGQDPGGHRAEAERITTAVVDQLWSESRS